MIDPDVKPANSLIGTPSFLIEDPTYRVSVPSYPINM